MYTDPNQGPHGGDGTRSSRFDPGRKPSPERDPDVASPPNDSVSVYLRAHLLRFLTLGAFALLPTLASAAPATRTESLDLGGGSTMEFVLIPAGSFTMGSEATMGDGDEAPKHEVVITQPFLLGKLEVTQAQWERVMGADHNPSRFRGANRPVDSVSWIDAQRFLEKLSALTGRRALLPTESQWEYACRAGTTEAWSWGLAEERTKDFAWYAENAEGTTHDAGTRAANAWGLHDMHGNVWEWCGDWYDKHAYRSALRQDPTGPATTTGSRVLRGGSWGDDPDHVRCAVRNCIGPDIGNHGTGFRVLLAPR